MADNFLYDVFLSHSDKDDDVARDIAERLRNDGIRVWFDEWEIKPGHSIPAKIDEGLENSRVLILCMSANTFGSDWSHLERYTFRFRDPLNKDLHLIPVRLDDAPIKGSLAQYVYIDWRQPGDVEAYTKLLEACKPPQTKSTEEVLKSVRQNHEMRHVHIDAGSNVTAYSFNLHQKLVVIGCSDGVLGLWDMETGNCVRTFSEIINGSESQP